MLDGRRKSIEPMAARLGEVHYQALHHFVAVSPWDWRPVRRRLAEHLLAELGPTAWAVDDTGFPKDGDHSVGVQRQYSGTLGKTANCQLGVSVNAVTEQASCPLDWRLFLPESWDDDRQRRSSCHLPERVRHRPKWQLVLDMLDELEGWGLRPPVLVADSADGRSGSSAAGWTTARSGMWCRSRPTPRPTPSRPLRRSRRPPGGSASPAALPRQALLAHPARLGGRAAGRRGADLAARQQGPATLPLPGPAGVIPRRQAAGRGDGAGWELPVRWLLVEWPANKAEPVKYWLSNLPETTPLVELVRLGKLRWRVEQDYRELKGALGLDHFEGRSWPGWHHHVSLVSVAHGFLTLERLRRPKQVASA
jgi:SRSO17 transposase